MDTNLDGVICEPLNIIRDDRGSVMHMMNVQSPWFERFGEVYFSTVKPKVVKAWKRHREMTQHLVVPIGMIRLVMFDSRSDSKTYQQLQVVDFGIDDYQLIKIPNGLWYGFQGLSGHDALIVNCADMKHDPTEVDRLPYDAPQIPHQWVVK